MIAHTRMPERLHSGLACLCLLFVACESARPTGIDDAIAVLRRAGDDGRLHGVASVLGPDGKVTRVFSGNVPGVEGAVLDERSIFRLASLTKLFTQIALLRLADEGIIELDAALRSYRPGLRADWAAQVTLRQLLAFRSGLPREWNDTSEISGVVYDADGRAESFLDGLAAHGPSVEPGTQTRYSNLGYMHLGAVLESVTGCTYAEALRELVLQPAGLTDTGLQGDPAVSGHESVDGVLQPVVPFAVVPRYAAGGLQGSLCDLERLARHLLDGTLLSEDATNELFTQFGRPDAVDPSWLRASGHVPGFANVLEISREPRYAVLLLNNAVGASPALVGDVLEEAVATLAQGRAQAENADPLAGEGWTRIPSLAELPERTHTQVVRRYLEAVLAGDETGAYEAAFAVFGFDAGAIEESTKADTMKNVRYELDLLERFGPFEIAAWRDGEGSLLEMYLQGPGERAIRYGFGPHPSETWRVNEKRHATIGFRP